MPSPTSVCLTISQGHMLIANAHFLFLFALRELSGHHPPTEPSDLMQQNQLVYDKAHQTYASPETRSSLKHLLESLSRQILIAY